MYSLPSASSLLSKRYAITFTLVIFALWILHDEPPDFETLRNFGTIDHNGYWMTQNKFVSRFLENGIYVDEYNGAAIRNVCRKTKWRDNVVVSCDKLGGDFSSLKMGLLGCTRYAIEAGAMMIKPTIHPRQEDNLTEDGFAWDVDLPLAHAFDSEYFYTTMAADCPQLRFVDENDPLVFIPGKAKAVNLNPKSLVATREDSVILEPAKWRPAFDKWLKLTAKLRGKAPTRLSPLRVSLTEGIQASWLLEYDGREFKSDWGHTARPSLHIRELAARMLHNLYIKIGCRQDPAEISKNCFLGVHMETKTDSGGGGGAATAGHRDTAYETQLAQVREQLLAREIPVLYVATGASEDVARLRSDIRDIRFPLNETHSTGVRVFYKTDIVGDDDLFLVDSLTWEQMAILDFDIMLRASLFVGIWRSSWTWMVALTRHLRTDRSPYEEHIIGYDDGLSMIYGVSEARYITEPCIYV